MAFNGVLSSWDMFARKVGLHRLGHVVDVGRSSFQKRAPHHGLSGGGQPGRLAVDLDVLLHRRTERTGREARTEHAVAGTDLQDATTLRVAELCGGVEDRLEHGVQVRRSCGDHPQHLGGDCLLLHRLRECAVTLLDLVAQ